MKTKFFIATVSLTLVFAAISLADETVASRGEMLLIQGSAGTDEYGQMFKTWTDRWTEAAKQGNVSVFQSIADESNEQQKKQIQQQLAIIEKDVQSPLWIVFIGHGTFDGRAAKINLAGPDLSAKELDELLAPISRTTIVVNCASSSAPFIEELSQQNRIIVTSTRSGEQINFSRFGDYLSSAISDPTADLDKDKQTSLLEAFLIASRKTLEFYEADGRIPTENALLDDNGDGKGTRSTAFQGVRVIAQPEEAGVLLDGFRAHQFHLIESDTDRNFPAEVIARRNELEQQIETLRLSKESLDEDEYYRQLEVLFLELGKLLIEKSKSDVSGDSNEKS